MPPQRLFQCISIRPGEEAEKLPDTKQNNKIAMNFVEWPWPQPSLHFLHFREIVDIHEKENALDIVTSDRVYHIVAESPEDARYAIEAQVCIS